MEEEGTQTGRKGKRLTDAVSLERFNVDLKLSVPVGVWSVWGQTPAPWKRDTTFLFSAFIQSDRLSTSPRCCDISLSTV